ncbi:hypothetical protein ACFU6E_28490 [Bacillus cereus]|uniref:hypothetical protein n=1 Tax=Bacillus cereus TaxID=1396 RepID=UPI00366B7EE0
MKILWNRKDGVKECLGMPVKSTHVQNAEVNALKKSAPSPWHEQITGNVTSAVV